MIDATTQRIATALGRRYATARIPAEDITQAILCTAWEQREKRLNLQFIAYRELEKLTEQYTWSVVRKLGPAGDRKTVYDNLDVQYSYDDTLDAAPEQSNTCDESKLLQVWSMVRQVLPHKQRQALWLHYRRGIPVIDIAKRWRVARTVVVQYLEAGVRAIREILRDGVRPVKRGPGMVKLYPYEGEYLTLPEISRRSGRSQSVYWRGLAAGRFPEEQLAHLSTRKQKRKTK